MQKYRVLYPYTATISLLTVINLIVYQVLQPPTQHYLVTLIFTFFFGIAQIHGLENLGNEPAWLFPPKSAYFQDIGLRIKNIVLEDILFIPNCASLFYFFLYATRDIPNIINSRYIVVSSIAILLIIEAIIYQIAGKGTRVLMVAYTLTPICALSLCVSLGLEIPTINITHCFLSFLFVGSVNCGWELFNAWRGHWIYNTNCDLLDEKGFFLNNKLHIGIFVQYFVSGWIVMYFSWVFLR